MTIDIDQILIRASELYGRQIRVHRATSGANCVTTTVDDVHYQAFDVPLLEQLGDKGAADEIAATWRVWSEAGYPDL